MNYSVEHKKQLIVKAVEMDFDNSVANFRKSQGQNSNYWIAVETSMHALQGMRFVLTETYVDHLWANVGVGMWTETIAEKHKNKE